MSSRNQLTAAEQINNLNQQLINARSEAYEARTALEASEEKIKALKNALSGAQIGAKFEQDRAEQEAAKASAKKQGDVDLDVVPNKDV